MFNIQKHSDENIFACVYLAPVPAGASKEIALYMIVNSHDKKRNIIDFVDSGLFVKYSAGILW